MERGKRPYTLFHGWCDVSYTCYQFVAGLGLELAIIGSAVRLTVDCAREPGLQKCSLFLRPLAKIKTWATSWQNKQNGLCTQRRLRSAWASAQSDQSLRRLRSAWASAQPDQSLRSVRAMDSWGPNVSSCGHWRLIRLICVFAGRNGHFVGFDMRRLLIHCSRVV